MKALIDISEITNAIGMSEAEILELLMIAEPCSSRVADIVTLYAAVTDRSEKRNLLLMLASHFVVLSAS